MQGLTKSDKSADIIRNPSSRRPLTVIQLIDLKEKAKKRKKELQELPWGSRLRADLVHDI